MARLGIHLRLGRVATLPTVWSNCLCGWLLAEAEPDWRLALLLVGASALYVAGAYLNDAFDADWDRLSRPDRPVPAGTISRVEVWQWGLTAMAVGLATLACLGRAPAALALALALIILLYDATHRRFALSPVLLGACRALLVLTAAASPTGRLTGLSLWSSLALGCYVVGADFLARKQTADTQPSYWPCLGLAAPVVLALIINRAEWQWRGLMLSGVLIAWVLISLRLVYWSPQRNLVYSAAALVAGIPLVDLLAVCGGPGMTGLIFAGLWGATRLLQRFLPGQ